MPDITLCLHCRALADFIPRHSGDFTDRSHYVRYKAAQIRQYRQQQLAWLLQCPEQSLVFDRNQYGKPLLTYPLVGFNQSHSQSFYALLLSRQLSDVGVDIENSDRAVRFEAVSEYALHPRELALWRDSGCDRRYWLQVWTVKEAVLKAAGLGIRLNLNEFDSGCMPQQAGGDCTHPAMGEFSYHSFWSPQWVLSVAWRRQPGLVPVFFFV